MDRSIANFSPADGRRPRGVASNRPLTVFVHAALLVGAAAGRVFLVAGPPQGSLGVFLGCAGIVLIFCPPRVKVDWRLWAAAGGVIGGSALAFLPAGWFGVPPWRAALAAMPAVVLPGSVTTAPPETAFWLAVMAVSALVGLFALAHPLRTAGVVGLACAAVAVCAAYAVLAIHIRQAGGRVPSAEAAFGLFPNRNHTATFLVVGSVLAMGLLRVAWRDGRWAVGILAAVGLTLFVSALGFFSVSRGGIVFLLVGTTIWAAGLGRREGSIPLFVSLATLLAAGALLFAVSGSEVRNRLLPAWNATETKTTPSGQVAAPDFRLPVYEDTARMIRDRPWTGAGLGTFITVFPQYRQESLDDPTVYHPESDWLMLAAETGVPTALVAAALWWGLLRRCFRWRAHPSWPLRWACAAAVAAACLHGVVDVPLHRAVLGWWVLVVAGIGLHGGWSANTGRSRVQHALFVAGGLLALGMGVQLVRAEWFGGVPLPPFATADTQAAVVRLFRAGDAKGAIQLVRQRLRAAPLTPPLYHQLGTLLAQAPHADAAVDEAFGAQRLVSPNDPAVPYEQGIDWILNDTARTAALWSDALARRHKIEQARRRGPPLELNLYREMMRRATDFPELQQALLDLKQGQPAFVAAWLGNATADVAPANLHRIALEISQDATLGEDDRKQFLMALYRQGGRDELPLFGPLPGWESAVWQVKVQQLIDGNQYEQLVTRASERAQVDLTLPSVNLQEPPRDDLGTLEQTDPATAFAAYWHAGNALSARRLLAEATQNGGAAKPAPELLRLKAGLAAHDENWSAAWQALDAYLRQTGRNN